MKEISFGAALQRFIDLLGSVGNSELNLFDALRRGDLTAYAHYALFRGEESPRSNVKIPVSVWHYDMPEIFDVVFDHETSSFTARTYEVPVLWAKRVYLDATKVDAFFQKLQVTWATGDHHPMEVAAAHRREPQRRGPKSKVYKRLKEAMREWDPRKLASLSGEAMRAQFKIYGADPAKGPSISTCMKCRDELEADRRLITEK